jgi:regulator of protease activity HflC (stomatin/prohibitin superfamily)
MKQNKLASLAVVGVIALILIITLSNSIFLTINAGEKGVLFKTFSGGLDKENIYSSGFHVIAPWNTMYRYDVRERQQEEEMTVLSNNGLNITIDMTVRVNPIHDKIGDLHEKFGEGYLESLVRAEVRSSARKIFGRFGPEELYSTKRDEVQTMIEQDLGTTLAKNFINLKAVLIRDITLPAKVKNAIEEKLEAEQSALKYEFILAQERKEAERKIIEANAKAESNRILNASLSDNILRDKGIEATLKLAESPNAKVVVVGGSDGLPLILGGQ